MLTAWANMNREMLTRVLASIEGVSISKTKEFQQLSEANQNGDNKKLVSLTLKKKDKIDQKIKDQFLNDEDDASLLTNPTLVMPSCVLCDSLHHGVFWDIL